VTDSRQLVDKLWNYCHLLRDDGVSTIDYTEQLTYLLFLKMAHERATRAINPEKIVPVDCSWQRLLDSDATNSKRSTGTYWRRWLDTPAHLVSSSVRHKTKFRTRPS
jgi:type I restriction-modification system DNA methylase subunit